MRCMNVAQLRKMLARAVCFTRTFICFLFLVVEYFARSVKMMESRRPRNGQSTGKVTVRMCNLSQALLRSLKVTGLPRVGKRRDRSFLSFCSRS